MGSHENQFGPDGILKGAMLDCHRGLKNQLGAKQGYLGEIMGFF